MKKVWIEGFGEAWVESPRFCADCGVAATRTPRAKRCERCQTEHHRKVARESRRRAYAHPVTREVILRQGRAAYRRKKAATAASAIQPPAPAGG